MKQIVTSPLDVDTYKFTMEAFIRRYFPELWVKFAFNHRSAKRFPLADLVQESELRRQLEMSRDLRFSDDDINYIASQFGKYNQDFQSDSYRSHLKNFRLPPVKLSRAGSEYQIETEGLWTRTTFWETIVLRIIARLAAETLANQRYGPDGLKKAFDVGRRLLKNKIALFRQYPLMRIIEFATRRAADPDWHFEALSELANGLLPGQLVGTSNVLFAKKLGLTPKGTMAHELFMAFAALMHLMFGPGAIRSSQMMIFDMWQEYYGGQLDIALCDTFTSKAFYEDFGPKRLKQWGGVRDDSGDPIDQTELYIRELLSADADIDVFTKTSFLADGQNPTTMVNCFTHFQDQVQTPFGPGTNISNDLGIPALSMVMKLVEIMWQERRQGTVKLSNNLRKAQGRPRDVDLYLRIFGAPPTDVECQY